MSDASSPPLPGSRPDPTAAVIIPHYNDSVRLTRCLEALTASPASALNSADIIVADNGSTEDLQPLLQRFPGVRFVTEDQKGAGPARNRGVAETSAPRLIFLDADCRPAERWLEHALALPLERTDIVGGRIDTFDETPPPRSGAEAFEAVFAFQQEVYITQKGFSVTANLVTTRALFEAAGPFRVGLSEDLEWCHRAVAAGGDLRYDDGLQVGHPTRQDWAALRRKWLRLTQESWGLRGRSFVARALWALRGPAVFASAVLHLPRVLRSPALTGPGERWRATLTLFRLRGRRALWMLEQALGLEIS